MTREQGKGVEVLDYRSDVAVLVIGGNQEAIDRARTTVLQAGCRVVDSVEMSGAIERVQRQVAMDAVFADLDEDHGEKLDQLLDMLNLAAGQDRYGSVLSVSRLCSTS